MASSTQAEVQARLSAIITEMQNAISNATTLKGEINSSDPVCAAKCQKVMNEQPLVDELVAYKQAYDEAVANG